MACATLKRHLDWEPVLGARPSKRRRCAPVCQSPPTTPTRHKDPSPFNEDAAPKLTAEKMAASIRDEIRRLHRRKQLQYTYDGAGGSASSECNLGTSPLLAMERMQTSSGSGHSSDSGSDAGNSSGAESPTPLSHHHVPRAEKALFTFKQVGIICERMVRERENELREQYDQVLAHKLAEQYDAFVKFTYDQIHRHYETAPSYLS